MKGPIKSSIIYLIILSGCRDLHQPDNIQSFIPGSYSAAINGEYSKGKNTLTIERADKESNSYIITCNSYYKRVLNGKLQNWEQRTEKWIAVYDRHDGILREQQHGKVFSFIPEKNELLIGTVKYVKLK